MRGDKVRAIVVIEGLLWRVQGEGRIMEEGTLENPVYHTDVMANGNWTCSSWKGRCDRIEMMLKRVEFWSDTGHCPILLCVVT